MQDAAHGEAASCEPRLPAAGRITILDRLFNKSSAPENGAFQLPLEPEEELNRPEARENELGDCHADPFPDGQMNMDETDIAPSRLEDPSYFTQGFLRVQKMLHHPDTGDQVKVLRRKGKAFSQGKAERLPFPAEYFDLVTSVGVMEHFLDTEEALREIRRILKPGGRYVSLVHVHLTIWERVRMAISEFVFPRFRPIQLFLWLKRKLKGAIFRGRRFVEQPIQNRYTTGSGKAWLARSGFTVSSVLHSRKYPHLPLIGPWVVIYVAEK